jgi:cysteine synthase A
MHWSRRLAREEGVFVGISAGGTFAAAMQVAREAPQGSSILCMLPDTGERYDMNEEELAVLRSTPTYADAVIAPVPVPPPPAPPAPSLAASAPAATAPR